MNLLWIAGLAVFVMIENVWHHRWIPPLSGSAIAIWGALVATR